MNEDVLPSEKSARLVVACVQDGSAESELRGIGCECKFVASPDDLATTEFQHTPALFVIEASEASMEATERALSVLRRQRPLTDCLVWMRRGSPESVRSSFLAGAKDVLVSEATDQLVGAIESNLENQQLLPRVNHVGRRRNKSSRFESLLSRSQAMWDLFDLCARIAPTAATVLIIGETGTGKELLARAIHNRSQRGGRFVAANCASIPPELINSELFGHSKGAFTGAETEKQGLITHADGGTLFLDEIGDMPSEAQLSLLRVLQEMKVRPVGSLVETKVDLRVIAATNVPLDRAVRDGNFREDLFYRLDVIRMNVPPLRDRPEDVLFLFGNFVKRLAREYGVDPPTYSDGFLDAMLAYEWPGNVRQLENFSERLVLARPLRPLTGRDFSKLRSSSLALHSRKTDVSVGDTDTLGADRIPFDPSKSLQENVKLLTTRLERAYLESVLAKTSGRISEAAELAGISRRTLLRKMNALQIDKQSFKTSPSP